MDGANAQKTLKKELILLRHERQLNRIQTKEKLNVQIIIQYFI